MDKALLAVVLLPALGALINGLRAANKPLEHKSRKTTDVIALAATALSAIVATFFVVLPYVNGHGTGTPAEFTYYTWIPSGIGQVGSQIADFAVNFAFRV